MRWERVRQQVGPDETSSGPGKRWGHTCNAIKEGRLLYVFGGYGKDNRQTNEVHVFDTATQRWSQPVMEGIAPSPRDSHTCTTVGDNLFVFGGTNGINPLNDLHILDTSSNTWICPNVKGEGPEAREGHSAAVVGKSLFIFGGCGRSSSTNDEIYYNDLYILDTETLVWKRAVTTGISPSPRDNHTCSSWKNKIIVVGGEDEHDYYLCDVHIIDADTLFWKQLNTSGQLLLPRAGHSTAAFGRNLFVFGGFTNAQNLYSDLNVLDVETGVWSKVLSLGEGPSARFSASGDCLDPYKSGVLVFMGGCNKNLEALDDMYYLSTGISSESAREERDLGMLSMKKQMKQKCQEQSLVIYDPRIVQEQNTGRQNLWQDQPQYFQGKRMFQASVTESMQLGYKIETIIDGKLLQGIVFTDKPGYAFAPAAPSSSRKRKYAGRGGASPSKSKARKTSRNDLMGSQQAQLACIPEEPSSHEREAALDLSDIRLKAANLPDVLILKPVESHEPETAAANPPGILISKAVESHEPETAAANPPGVLISKAVESKEPETAVANPPGVLISEVVESHEPETAAVNPSSILFSEAVESHEPETAAANPPCVLISKSVESHEPEAAAAKSPGVLISEAVESHEPETAAANPPGILISKAVESHEPETAAANPPGVLISKAVESHEPETVAATDAKTQFQSDVLQIDKERLNLEPSSSSAPLDLNDQTNEADEPCNEVPTDFGTAGIENLVLSSPKQDETVKAAERREDDDPAESAHQ